LLCVPGALCGKKIDDFGGEMDSEGLRLFFQLILSGLIVGCIYASVALGFVLIYKATDIINFAQGELMLAGPTSVMP
jgi:hypothetical protein